MKINDFSVMQLQIPQESQNRMFAYEALGCYFDSEYRSFVQIRLVFSEDMVCLGFVRPYQVLSGGRELFPMEVFLED